MLNLEDLMDITQNTVLVKDLSYIMLLPNIATLNIQEITLKYCYT
jgi:hypothetical protein